MSSNDESKEKLAEERTEWAHERTEWAEERTEWADQRTYLAQQRTYSGWLRTGLTSMAVGFGIVEFMRDVEPTWLISAIGFLFITIGAAVVAIAFISFRHVSLKMQRMREVEMAIPVWWTAAITVGLLLSALGGMAVVFL